MSKARDLANLGTDTAALATDSEVTAAVAPKANSTDVDNALALKANATNGTLTYPLLKSPEETWTVAATAATGTINFDLKTQGVLYYTANASGNFTLNLRGDGSTSLSSMVNVGDSITCNFMVTNGGTAYYCTAVQVDGVGQTVKWSGGTAPASGNASSVDVYSVTVVKTAATPTYTVFAAGPIKYA